MGRRVSTVRGDRQLGRRNAVLRRFDDDAWGLGIEAGQSLENDGALEAANGVLLFGVSTAFLAAFLTEAWTKFRKLENERAAKYVAPS